MGYYCSGCGEEIKKKVYSYSKNNFDEPLCRECQEKSRHGGLSKYESFYKESMIKGRIAETLVEELFLSGGYEVYRYGMENTVPGITKKLKRIKNDVSYKIRNMPDFVIQDSKDRDKLFFVEVKFRKSEKFDRDDISDNYPFENCYFVIVSKEHIKCITYQELEKGDEITPDSKKYLGWRPEFDLDKDKVKDFCDFAVKFFEGV